VSAATIVTAWLFVLAVGESDGFLRTSYALVGSLLALAVLEHWFLVLPLRDSLLWNWALHLAGRETQTGDLAPAGATRVDLEQAPSIPIGKLGRFGRAGEQTLRRQDVSAARIAP
jgi:hypothetical protein